MVVVSINRFNSRRRSLSFWRKKRALVDRAKEAFMGNIRDSLRRCRRASDLSTGTL